MKHPVTMAFVIYHEGDPRLDDVIQRVVSWINTNSQFEIIPIIRKATWDGVISQYSTTPLTHHLDSGDVDQSEIPKEANFVVILWSAKQPGKPELHPHAAGHPYGPDANNQKKTGTTKSYLSVPYHTFWDPFLPEGTDTTDPDRAGALARAIAKSGWPTGLDSTLIHEFQNMLVATLWDKYKIKMKSTYRPIYPFEEWFDDQDPQWAYEPTLYKAVFAAMTQEMYEKLADFIPEPPVVIPPVEPPAPTIPSGLRDSLLGVLRELSKIIDGLP